ncbi:MAG: hypothetical protein WCD08_01985 [Steroidobacteraceae bacterium]
MTGSTCVLTDIVDLDRYPIHQLGTAPGAQLVARCRASLASTGVCELAGFLLPGAIRRAIELALSLLDRAWASDQGHNVYFEPIPDEAAVDDPLAMVQHSAKRAIAYDLLPTNLPLRVLYESPEMTAFVAAALGRGEIFRSADPLDALEIAVFTPGDQLGWHFDNSEFSVTIMLQDALDGGQFDYVPGLRSHDDPNHDGVSRFLRGVASVAPIRLDPAPGTLSLFRGRLALHRVTRVAGVRDRINAVLTYGENRGMQLSELTRQLFYGRLA